MMPLALTQMCIASSLGLGLDANAEALRNGRGGLAPCAFETVDIKTHVGAIDAADGFSLKDEWASYDCRNNRLAGLALQSDNFIEAVAKARQRYGANRIGVFLGTSTSGILESEISYRDRDATTGALKNPLSYAHTQNTFSVAAYVRQLLQLDGPSLVVSAACASTTKAFGNAARMIETGLVDAAIVGGADSLCLTTLYGFQSLGLISTRPCRPFDEARDGISIGEGAAFVLLEKAAPENDACVRLIGLGESSDAYHMSSPHPEGFGARMAMERALASGQTNASEIDYIKLHGTATPVGDAAEDHAVFSLFGEGAVCSSLKGHVGHTLGASGIIEAVLCAIALKQNFIPGTLQTETLDKAMQARHLTRNQPGRVRTVMANSFGFGGSNCSLLLQGQKAA